MKEKNYYYYDTKGNPVIEVYLIDDGVNVGRGVSIRSEKDEVDKKHTLARNRALRAIKKRKLNNNKIKDWRAIKTLIKYNAPFIYHSELNPCLGFYERKLLFGKKLFEYEDRSIIKVCVDPHTVLCTPFDPNIYTNTKNIG